MVLEKTLPLIFIFIIGILLKKKGILKKEDSTIFSNLLLYIVIPCIAISAFVNVEAKGELLYLPLAGFMIVLSLTAFGFFFSHVLKLKDKTRSSFIVAFPTLEGGLIGYAFMIAAFGELGLSRIILFDISNGLFLFTVIYMLSCYFGERQMKLKEGILKFLKTPIIWAIFIGIFLNVINFHNALVFNFLDMIGGSLLFLMMLLVGLEFEFSLSSFKLPSITMFLKTAVGLFLGFIVLTILNLEGVEKAALLVFVSLPPSVLTLAFAKENNLDTKYNANLLSLSLPVSIVFILILLNFL